jgi:ferredoxin-type protein NapH
VSKRKLSPSQTHWTRWRRVGQLIVLGFFLLLPLTYRLGQNTVLGTLASLQLGPISLIEPAAGISTVLAARQIPTPLLTGIAIPIIIALVLGPVFCSWVCPWGLLSESLDILRGRKRRPASRWVKPLRWTVLVGVFILSFWWGTPLAATVSAPRLISALPGEILFLGGVSSGTAALLGGLLALELILPRRLWCRSLCPVGSFLVLLRTPWTLRVAWKSGTCLGVGRPLPTCVTCCPWSLDPRELGTYDGCTNCGRCIEQCPSEPEGSLSYRFRRSSASRGEDLSR